MIDVANLNITVKVDQEQLDELKASLGEVKNTNLDGANTEGLQSALTKANVVGGLVKDAIVAAGKAAIEFGKDVYESYASYEQLSGGVEKIFGNASDTMSKYADNAFKTVQMSKNEYLELSTQFGASMINSLGGDQAKAAEQVNKAIIQMRDNSSIMGTDIQQLQTAYSGFARGNFMALDNLKLGFAGSKEGMEALLEKATELSGVEYNIESYSDIVDAIQVVQDDLKISGNAALEATETLEGTLNATSSAFENFKTDLMNDNADIEADVENLVESASNFLALIVPRIGIVLDNILDALLNFLQEQLPKLVTYLAENQDEIVAKCKEVIPKILEVLGLLLVAILQVLGEILLAIGELIWEGLQSLWTTYVVPWWNNVKSSASSAWANFKSGVSTRFNEIISNISTWFNTMITNIKNKITEWKNAGVNLVTNLWNGMQSWFSQLPSKVSSAIQNIWNTIKNWASNFYNIGANLGTNLWNGMVGWFNKIANKISDLWDSLWSVNSSSSHRAGFNYVPTDGYIAELHKGEMVLSRAEAEQYRSNEPAQQTPTTSNVFNITVPNNDNAMQTALNIRNAIRKERFVYGL